MILTLSSPHLISDSASMLIMVLAQAQASNNATLVQNYVSDIHYDCMHGWILIILLKYGLLKKWADYLIDNSLNLGFGSQYVSSCQVEVCILAYLTCFIDESDDGYGYWLTTTAV